MDFLLIQFLNGLASASYLFLVASGLSIIFGVTRIVNFAHGSFYMLGAYIAYTLVTRIGDSVPGGFWMSLLLAAVAVAALGALIEVAILRRIYRAPELFQLLATFGVVLIVQDLVVLVWGPQDLLGPRAPGLQGAVRILGSSFPAYDLLLIALGPAVLLALTLLFRRTRWGILVRAATQDREMVTALGIRQGRLFTQVFVLGAFLAGLGGAVQLPRASVHHGMDLQIIVETFVVVVVGGLGSVPGAYLASVLLGVLNAFGIVVLPQVSLALAFLMMAVVLVVRPWGLLGRPEAMRRASGDVWDTPVRPLTRGRRDTVFVLALALAILPVFAGDYLLNVMAEVMIFALFAASLHFLMGVGGMASFGHAAYFGLGAYGAALATTHSGLADDGSGIGGTAAGGAGGADLRLVLRAAHRRLPGDADAGVRSDRLVDRLPVVRRHRRRQRHPRRLAIGMGLLGEGILLPVPRRRRYRDPRLAPVRLRAIRHGPARLPRFTQAGGGDRHRSRPAPASCLCHRRRFRRRERRALRLPQGQRIPGRARHPALGGWPGHGPARRRTDAHRAGCRRRRLQDAASVSRLPGRTTGG